MASDVPSGLLTQEQEGLVVKVSNSDFNKVLETSVDKIEKLLTAKVSISATPSANDIVSLAGNLNAVIPAGFLLLHNDLEAMSGGDSGEASSESGVTVSSLLTPMLVGAGAAVVATGIVKGLFGGFSQDTTDTMAAVVESLNQNLKAEDLSNDLGVLTAQKEGFITYLKTYYLQQSASLLVSGTIEAVGEGASKAATTFLNTLFGKAEDDEKTPTKLQTVLDAVLNAVEASDYVGDEDVDAAVKIGIVNYIKTYFVSQTTSSAVNTTVTGVATAAANGLKSFVGTLLGKTPKDSSTSKIQTIIDDLIKVCSSSKLTGDDDVEAAIKSGVIGYIKTYFASQTTSKALTTATSGVATAAATAVTSFVKGILGVGAASTSHSHIQTIVDDLISDYSSTEAKKNSDIKSALKTGIKGYIETYFKAETDSMALDSTVSSLSTVATTAVKSFLSSVFGLNSKATSSQHLKDLADALIESVTSEEVEGWDETEAIKKSGILSYITSYFESQKNAALLKDVSTALATSAGTAVKSFFTSIFSKDTSDTGITHIKNIADALLEDVDKEEVSTWDGVEDSLKSTVTDFLKSYFKLQEGEALVGDTFTSLTTIAGKAVKAFFTSVFGKAEAAPSSKGADTLKAIGDGLLEDMNVKEVLKWDEIVAMRKSTIVGFTEPYLQLQADAAIEAVEEQSKSKEGLKQKFIGWLFGKEAETSPTADLLLEVVDKLATTANASTLAKDPVLVAAQKNGIGAFVISYLEAMSSVVGEASKESAKDAWNSYKNKNVSDSDKTKKPVAYYNKIFEIAYSTTSFPAATQFTTERNNAIKNVITSILGAATTTLKNSVNDMVSRNTGDIIDSTKVKTLYTSIATSAFSTTTGSGYPTASELASVKKEGVLNIAKSMLNAAVTSLRTQVDENKITFRMDTRATISQDNTTSENTSKMVTTLSQISTLLSELSTYIQNKEENANSNVGNVTVVNTGSNRTDNLDVVIPG